jgi:hypothetical protein
VWRKTNPSTKVVCPTGRVLEAVVHRLHREEEGDDAVIGGGVAVLDGSVGAALRVGVSRKGAWKDIHRVHHQSVLAAIP